jgi:hypothetical protein
MSRVGVSSDWRNGCWRSTRTLAVCGLQTRTRGENNTNDSRTIRKAARGSILPPDHFPPVQGVGRGLEDGRRHGDVSDRALLIVN